MNDKLIALKRTLVMVVLACFIPLLISFLLTFDSEQIGWTMLTAIFAYACWIVYAINLNQVRHEMLTKNETEN